MILQTKPQRVTAMSGHVLWDSVLELTPEQATELYKALYIIMQRWPTDKQREHFKVVELEGEQVKITVKGE